LFGSFLGWLIIGYFIALLDKFVSDSLDNLRFVFLKDLDSLSQSGILFNRWIELNGSSSIFKINLVDSFRIRISVLRNWFDSISVVLEVLVMIGVIFRLGHGL
jgi:hypothetical protein